MIIIGDVHGCYATLIALLKKIPQEQKDKGVIIAGDLIDRGPKSMQVVEFVKNSDILCVKGNHEEMMTIHGPTALNLMANGRHPNDVWTVNGGDKTLQSYEVIDSNHGKLFSLETFEEHMEWMAKLPIYLEYPNLKHANGKHLVISHSFVINAWKRFKAGKITEKELAIQALWCRPHKFDQQTDIYNVVGHTPHDNNPRIKSFYANVDTGCFLGLRDWKRHRGALGRLTALQFPEMIIYEQECLDETPIPQTIFGEIDDE